MKSDTGMGAGTVQKRLLLRLRLAVGAACWKRQSWDPLCSARRPGGACNAG